MHLQVIDHHQILTLQTMSPLDQTDALAKSFQVCFFEKSLKASKKASFLRKYEDWSSVQKLTYARLLLSYLIKNIDVNCYFLQHLSQLLDRTPTEVYGFHRKMLSQFKSSKRIVTHLLKSKIRSFKGRNQKKAREVEENAFTQLSLSLKSQVQENQLDEMVYLQKMILTQKSLDEYEEDFEDNFQVFDLENDEQLDKEVNTSGSFQAEEWDEV